MAAPKRADVVAALEKAGITFDATLPVKDLVLLLPEVAGVQDQPVAEPAATVAEAAPEVGAKGTATVYAKNGNPLRTYSKEIHGEDYKDNAKSYAEKVGGTWK